MRSWRLVHRCCVAGAVVALSGAFGVDDAVAGEFFVGNCRSDKLGFSTRAFKAFTRGKMKVNRVCYPVGDTMRALMTGNVVRDGKVPRGAVAGLVVTAPPGTWFTSLNWAGKLHRTDCRYAIQLWADNPDAPTLHPVKNMRANENCPKRRSFAQARDYPIDDFDISGATRIVQRVICVGDDSRKWCSARGSNYLETYEVLVGIADVSAPSATIIRDAPLALGEWVGGIQGLDYVASDNVGVRRTLADASGRTGGYDERACWFAKPEEVYADFVPCPNGRGQIQVDTSKLPDGTQALTVLAMDTAANFGESEAVNARIDNAPPGRVDVGVDGGQQWRNRNDFVLTWANPAEPDRAPIVAARYKLCPGGAGACIRVEQPGADNSHLAVRVPAPGEWTLSLWRRDAAGNEDEQAASVPVTLRYDPEPPQLAFEPRAASDPTLVAVAATDKVSGLASGVIEISAVGSGTWQTLATEKSGERLVARIDDSSLPPGAYQLRARAFDHAGNEVSTELRIDGQPMTVNLPLRIVSSMKAGFERTRVVRRVVRKHARRVIVRRPEVVVEPTARVASGEPVQVVGRLVNREGEGISGAEIRVLSSSTVSPEQLVAMVRTDGDGRYRYMAIGSTSRTLRFAYPGSQLVLPSERTIAMSVPGLTSLQVSRRRVLNGQAVMFHGRLRTQPAPAGGKLVELQAQLSDRWQTFRTARTDAAGRWSVRYRFKRTRGVQRFRFRARLPEEAGYPFGPGGSHTRTVRVRGL